MNYECHITVTVADEPVATEIATRCGWKTSEIKRDPLLGDGSHFYLTRHSKSHQKIFEEMQFAAAELRLYGATVLREKIELIVYDTKTGIGF